MKQQVLILINFLGHYYSLQKLGADAKSVKLTLLSASTTPTTHNLKKCNESQEDLNFPYENNCKHYYRCVYGRMVEKICHDNMLFNKDLGDCDHYYNVIECLENERIKTPETETNFDLSNENHYYESQDVILSQNCLVDTVNYYYIPHESNCNAYYICQGGVKTLLFCPTTLRFNYQQEFCDYHVYNDCKTAEKVTSTSATSFSTTTDESSASSTRSTVANAKYCSYTVYKPYENDPRQYKRCINGVEVVEYCPNKLVFDVKLGVCSIEYYARTVKDS